jgi:predicted GNAT family N-acyltransferase
MCFDRVVEIVEFGPLTDELRAQLEGDETDPFDASGIDLRFRRKEHHVALRGRDGTLVASTGLLVVDVEVAPARFPVVGIGGVIVNEHWRGRGLARQVVEAALEKARTLGPDFALLFCHDDRAGLYLRLGFADVASAVRVEQPDGYASIPQRTMWRALHPQRAWPAGELTVLSLPF